MSNPGMRINLLKNRRVLSEKDYIREKQFLRLATTGMLIVVVITIAMAIWNFTLSRRLASIEGEIAQANTQMAGLANANAEQLYVKNRLSLIGNFLNEQEVAREGLQQVLALSIPGVTISGLTFESATEVAVVVAASSQSALAEVVAYYEQKDGYFPQIITRGLSRNKDGLYEMQLLLTLPASDSV